MKKVDKRNDRYGRITTINFVLAGVFSFMLFAGTFSTRVEEMSTMLFDRYIVLLLGFFVPILTVIGVISFILSYFKDDDYLKIKGTACWISICFILYCYSLSVSYFIELLKLQFNS